MPGRFLKGAWPLLLLLLLSHWTNEAQAQKGKKSVKGGKKGGNSYPSLPKAIVATTARPTYPTINMLDKYQDETQQKEDQIVQKPDEFGKLEEEYVQKPDDFGSPREEFVQKPYDYDQNERIVQKPNNFGPRGEEIVQQPYDYGDRNDRVVQPPVDLVDQVDLRNKQDELSQYPEQVRDRISEKYRDGEINQVNDQDTPPERISVALVAAGDFCSTWGPDEYRTFDGRLFRFPGTCRHVLFKDCIHEESFSVVLDFSECRRSSDNSPCRATAIVGSGEESLSIRPGLSGAWEVLRRGQRVGVPLIASSLSVQLAGRYMFVKASCGAMLWMDSEGSVTVQLPVGWRWRTCGLCGHKNGNPQDDFMSPTSELMADPWTFGNAWMMRDPDAEFVDGCPEPDLPTTPPCGGQWNKEMADRASDSCLPILSPKFSECHKVLDPQPYLEACQSACCSQGSQGGCECSTLAEYFRECKRAGGRSPPDGWRTTDLCPLTCDEGSEYSECSPSCRPTCADPAPACDLSQCLDGCRCPLNYVMHENTCIPRSQCPCSLRGKDYPGGHVLQEDCNTCECQQGRWRCTEQVCPGACRVVGNGQLVTFDGFWYQLPKACSHHLLLVDGQSVGLENLPCKGAVTKGRNNCGRNIVIRTGPGAPVIRIKRWLEVTVDGEELTSLPVTISDIHIRMISSLYVQALLPNGVSVTWSAEGSSGWVSVPASFFGRTAGLCGTFTRSQADDFLTPEGDTELGPAAFARKWKTDGTCLDPEENDLLEHACDLQPHLRPKAEQLCSAISHGEAFQECRDLLDPAPFYGACVREVCGCRSAKPESCLCPLLEHLAVACAKKTGSSVHWRASVPACGVHCPPGQEYRPCASPCQYSCAQASSPFAARVPISEGVCDSGLPGGTCLDGCGCPNGQALTTLTGGRQVCVHLVQCPCLHEGREHPPGFIQHRKGKICECNGGRWECRFDPTEGVDGRGYIDEPCAPDTNTESSGCLSDCPLTCLNMNAPTKCHTKICKAGCKCKAGFVLEPSSGLCIRPAQCPCHHGGRSYADGEATRMDCNNCLCKGGQWVCETSECLGKCSLYGAGHYVSFDGRSFDLQSGHCAYVLLKGTAKDGRPFAITAQNIPCPSLSYKTSGPICKKELRFTLGEESVTLNLETPPVTSRDFLSGQVGMFQHLSSPLLGIEVLWDGHTRAYLHADSTWKGQLRGLCGDFNGDPSDDFVGPSGGPAESSAGSFADAWRLHPSCPSVERSFCLGDTCPESYSESCSPEKRQWAVQRCHVIKSELFTPCHSEVDHLPYLDRCAEDSCECEEIGGTCECFCTAIAAYADACAARGVAIAWRSQELCPIQCEECDHYNPCINVCPLDDCLGRLASGRPECKGRPCVEGCEVKPCLAGQVRNGTTPEGAVCVPEALCEPKWDCYIKGKHFRHGDWVSEGTLDDACQTCYCHQGALDCRDQECPPMERLIKEIVSLPPATTPRPTPKYEKKIKTKVINISECTTDSWSHWINANTPTIESGGDFEILDDPKSRLRTHVRLPCTVAEMTAIECRQVAPSRKGKPKDDFQCTLPTGLVCQNRKGPEGVCRDYEIRVFCQCLETYGGRGEATPPPYEPTTYPPVEVTEPPVVALVCLPENHGWTEWVSTTDALSNPQGDFETLESLLAWAIHEPEGGGGCPLDHMTDIQCRVKTNGKSWKEAQQTDVTCDLTHGLTCLNSHQAKGKKCLDYEIRVFCQCYTTPSEPPTTYPPTIAGPVCPPGVYWNDCMFQCNQVCKAYQHKLEIEGKCDLSSDQCVAGCQYADCVYPFVHLDEFTCVQAADCDCVLDDGALIRAGAVIQRDCKRCQCQNNSLYCADVPGCGFASTGHAQVLATTCPPPSTPQCDEGFKIQTDDSGPCTEYTCVPECPPSLVWYDCHASCERSCLSLRERKCDREGCVAGCFCPEGTVRDGDSCKPPEECPDRVCQGFGDPQLVTFDGSLFPFQGKGTFTLANHMESSFSVSGRSEPCDGKLTCLVGLTVGFKGHKVVIRRGEDTVTVDEHQVDLEHMPLEVAGMTVIAYPGFNVLVVVPELQAEVFYFGTNAAFAIRVPVSLFFNKTRGLCGNCNMVEEDEGPDLDHNGIPDPESICSFMTEGFYGECLEENQQPLPIPDRETVSALCPEFSDKIFETCARLVDPWPYRTGCARDVTQGSNSHAALCKALLEFTRQCCLATGSPVYGWMESLNCKIPCPGGAKFYQCHDACPQTCANMSVAGENMCHGMLTDACFCEKGMVFHNGRCMSQSVCEACDAEGHRPGDSWQDGPCKKCRCEENLKAECTVTPCPSAPACRYDEKLQVDSKTDPCCLKYTCELKPKPTCPPPSLPNCQAGEAAKIRTNVGLCPEYACECDPALCPPVRWPSDLELGERVEVNKDGVCCGSAQVVCDKDQCPLEPYCPPGTILKQIPGPCCDVYKCKPPEDQCVYTSQIEVEEGMEVPVPTDRQIPALYKPGEKWRDGLCRNCTCVEQTASSGTGFTSSCMMEQCPDVRDSPDKNDYVLEAVPLPGECCPHIARLFCKDQLGEIHEVGSDWKSPEDTCLSYRCEISPLGDVHKVERNIVCATCPEGSEYVSPSVRLGLCCGWCRPVFCEEAGRNYPLGAKWNSTVRRCYTVECLAADNGSGVRAVYHSPNCPMVPKECPKESVTWDETGCCKICTVPLMPASECQPTLVPEEETVGLLVAHDPRKGRCANDKPLPGLKQCAGHCASHSLYSIDGGIFQSNCECCVAESYESFHVSLKCGDWGGAYLQKSFQQPTACRCSPCTGADSGSGTERERLQEVQQLEKIQSNKGAHTGGINTKWSFPNKNEIQQQPIDSHSHLKAPPVVQDSSGPWMFPTDTDGQDRISQEPDAFSQLREGPVVQDSGAAWPNPGDPPHNDHLTQEQTPNAGSPFLFDPSTHEKMTDARGQDPPSNHDEINQQRVDGDQSGQLRGTYGQQSEFGQYPDQSPLYAQRPDNGGQPGYGPSPFAQFPEGHSEPQSSHSQDGPSHSGDYSQGTHGGQGNALDDWNRQMAEHRRQEEDLIALQKTYTQLAHEQHRQQLEDTDYANQQQQAHG